MAATAARAAPHPATPIAPTRAVPPANVAILRISYTPSKTAGSNTLAPNLRARVVGLGARRVPDGQPFGLGPAGVAVAAQHASIYARPLRRSAYRPSRPATTAPDGARVPAVRVRSASRLCRPSRYADLPGTLSSSRVPRSGDANCTENLRPIRRVPD